MTRKEILDIINGIILEEIDTVAVTEESKLSDSNLDSFGYAMFWVGLTTKLKEIKGVSLSKECIEGYDLHADTCITVSKIIDDIEAL